MAIRKPAWDMSREQIDALAKGVKLDRDTYMRTQPHVRADSTGRSEADKEAIDQMLKVMTPEEVRTSVLEFSAARARGEQVTLAEYVARADAAIKDFGLVQTTTYDAANRPIHQFRSLDGRKHWMTPYRAVVGLMTSMTNNTTDTRRQHQDYLAAHPEAKPL